MREEKKEMKWNNNEHGESEEDFNVLGVFNTLCTCFLYYTFKPFDFNMYYRFEFSKVLVLSTHCVGAVCNPYLNRFIWIYITDLNLPKCWCLQHIVLVLSVIYIQIFDFDMYYKFEFAKVLVLSTCCFGTVCNTHSNHLVWICITNLNLPKCWCFQYIVLVLSAVIYIQIIWF